METKLSRYGDNLALIIDKSILERLHITEETILILSTDGQSITLTPQHSQTIDASHYKISDDPSVQKAFEETLNKYDQVFKKLSRS